MLVRMNTTIFKLIKAVFCIIADKSTYYYFILSKYVLVLAHEKPVRYTQNEEQKSEND